MRTKHMERAVRQIARDVGTNACCTCTVTLYGELGVELRVCGSNKSHRFMANSATQAIETVTSEETNVGALRNSIVP